MVLRQIACFEGAWKLFGAMIMSVHYNKQSTGEQSVLDSVW